MQLFQRLEDEEASCRIELILQAGGEQRDLLRDESEAVRVQHERELTQFIEDEATRRESLTTSELSDRSELMLGLLAELESLLLHEEATARCRLSDEAVNELVTLLNACLVSLCDAFTAECQRNFTAFNNAKAAMQHRLVDEASSQHGVQLNAGLASLCDTFATQCQRNFEAFNTAKAALEARATAATPRSLYASARGALKVQQQRKLFETEKAERESLAADERDELSGLRRRLLGGEQQAARFALMDSASSEKRELFLIAEATSRAGFADEVFQDCRYTAVVLRK